MRPDTLLFFRILFSVMFVLMLAAGIYLFKYRHVIFRENPGTPHETPGSRLYAKGLVFLVWLHGTVLTGALALGLH
jgi:hypothetical protein